MQRIQQRGLTTQVLDVHVQRCLVKSPCREMCESVAQQHAATAAGVQRGVREHQLTAPRPQVKLDHVDPNLVCRIERRQRVGWRKRARAAVPDPLDDM